MYTIWRVLLAAAFAIATIVPIPPGEGRKTENGTASLKVMFVGDSITHGHEAAYTWRYRMWQWLKFHKIPFSFVGPYTGTIAPGPPKPPQPPRPVEWEFHNVNVDEWPRVSGGYAENIDKHFDAHHFATSGDRADRVYALIHDRVQEFKPDMLLILLGVNDFGWGGATPDLLLGNMKRLVDNARSAKSDLKMAIGNVIQRNFVRPGMEADTNTYNKMLADAIPNWSSTGSPLHYVDVASVYDCHANGTCPAGMDGLHPNELGDYQIASAFAKTLIEKFSIGAFPLQIPANFSSPDLSPPSNVSASATPMGTKVTWERRYGITEFQVRERRENGEWTMKPIGTNRSDTVFPAAGIKCEYQVRSCYGSSCGPWPEEIVSAISERATAPPPIIIRTLPTELGFNVTWDPPEGTWNISSYEIRFKNLKTNVTLSVGSERLWARLEGMKEGEFSIVGETIEVQMASWMGEGYGGVYSSTIQTRPVLPGSMRRPERPRGLSTRWLNSTAVKLAWTGNASDAAGHLAYLKRDGADPVAYGGVTYASETVVMLDDAGSSFDCCLSAINGDMESPLACATPGSMHLQGLPRDYTRMFSQGAAFYFFVLALVAFATARGFRKYTAIRLR